MLVAVVFAAPCLRAQDKIVTRTGTQEGRITGMAADGSPLIKLASGVETKVNRADVVSVTMAEPQAMAAAREAAAAGNWDAALKAVREPATKFRGLPAAWVIEALGMVGDALMAAGDFAGARTHYDAFAKAYAGSPLAAQADVGLARLAIAEKRLPDADKILSPIVAEASKVLLPDDATARVYGAAFFAAGELEEARSQPSAALENYLRVVTLYASNPSLVALAQARAKSLAAEPGVFVKEPNKE